MDRLSMKSSNFLEDLVRLRPFLLYKVDQENHLISTNESGIDNGDEPPILFMSIGNGEFVHHYRKSLTESELNILNSIIFQIESQNKTGFYEEWENICDYLTGYDGLIFESGPAFLIPDDVICANDVIEVGIHNRDVLKKNFKYSWENLEYLIPCSAKLIDGKAVSICRTVRKHKNVLECGVDTVDMFRGKGYGSSVVASWASRVWGSGQIPCYSTQWDNHASMALAKKLKLRQYAVDIVVNFSESR